MCDKTQPGDAGLVGEMDQVRGCFTGVFGWGESVGFFKDMKRYENDMNNYIKH